MYKRAINRTKNAAHTYTNSLYVYYKKFLFIFACCAPARAKKHKDLLSMSDTPHIPFLFILLPREKSHKVGGVGRARDASGFYSLRDLETRNRQKKEEV